MSLRRLFTVLLGCPHVGHSLMGLMGSASMMVTITMFCGAADGVDDDISVGRQMVSTMTFPLGGTVGPWFVRMV
ncbi:hypothetical protein [Corynebacterium diphtheriae]|uniref:hypothetical protein n=1 Tax=Corynebacterium diphtheriae TaxID=1717 RepID=UPI0011775C09|nr:hypothetical protein [Corynebacterium diphtheriae]